VGAGGAARQGEVDALGRRVAELQEAAARAAEAEAALAGRVRELEAAAEAAAGRAREQEGRVAVYEDQLLKHAEALARIPALEQQVEELSAGGGEAALRAELERERKAAGKAAEEKLALLEMLTKTQDDLRAYQEQAPAPARRGSAAAGGGAREAELEQALRDKETAYAELEARLRKVPQTPPSPPTGDPLLPPTHRKHTHTLH
jgi:hypothetical protein